MCWQRVTPDMLCQGLLLGPRVSFMSCCCVYGEGWGMHCALCPPSDSGNRQRITAHTQLWLSLTSDLTPTITLRIFLFLLLSFTPLLLLFSITSPPSPLLLQMTTSPCVAPSTSLLWTPFQALLLCQEQQVLEDLWIIFSMCLPFT